VFERHADVLTEIRDRRAVRVAVRTVPSGVANSPVHLERALAQRFGAWLGVSVEFVEASSPRDANAALALGKADVAAHGAPMDAASHGRHGPHIRAVSEIVVYRRRQSRPRNLDEISVTIAVPDDPGAKSRMRAANANVEFNDDGDTPAHLDAVWRKRVPLAVVGSDYLATLRALFPEVTPAFTLSDALPVAWGFAGKNDSQLRLANIYFLNELRRSGELARILPAHLGHREAFDYVATQRVIRGIRERLPALAPHFRQAGANRDIDCRLLAALAYQESHWNPDAVSPTGVKGLMMLTQRTAKALGVDREDPVQSIREAAQYLARLRSRVSEKVPVNERIWFAVAAYNLGAKHVAAAQTLTGRAGANPHRWADVAHYLPRLRQSLWYSQLDSGRARGDIAARYVRSVRSYHEVLQWHDRGNDP
jgi:membrane-bound lytic murein transglycosylase F